MNPITEQTLTVYRNMPLSRKIFLSAMVLLLIAAFAGMFLWANKIDYQPVYASLSPEDAAEIVEKLKEQRISYRLENGGVVMVPADKVYDIRLSLAGSGIPRGGTVGYEIFDETDFGATEFVQKLNYQRALQGELTRTIKEFREVIDARVMIVMGTESVFIEETKPSSASVLLKLKSDLSKEKISAVVHLVASAVEDLQPEMVTVVDTNGRVLSKGSPEEEKTGNIANTQLEYKMAFEKNLSERIQTMLERIVGQGKAIVRVTADMEFDQVDINEEVYDPDAQVIRSRQNSVETSDKKNSPSGKVSSVNPVVAAGRVKEADETNKRQDETVNYEISRTIRRTVKPVGGVNRLSVAAVLDGNYQLESGSKGKSIRKYVPRSKSELEQFQKIVQQAMGYDADRGDQISVESFPFAYMQDMDIEIPSGSDWHTIKKEYGRLFLNIILIVLLVLFVIRPAAKTIKEIKATVMNPALSGSGKKGQVLLGPATEGVLPETVPNTPREKASFLARENVEKTTGIVRDWLSETK